MSTRQTFLSCCLILTALALGADDQRKETVTCVIDDSAEFAILEILYTPREYDNDDYEIRAPAGQLVYPVVIKKLIPKGKIKQVRYLALIPAAKKPENVDQMKWSLAYFSEDNTIRSIVKDKERHASLMKDWENKFREILEKRAESYEDAEPEYLLYTKFFGETIPNRKETWKENPVLNLLYLFSGMQDVRNAIPLHRGFNLANHRYTEEPPEPIALPKVIAKPADAKPEDFPLACMVPRSCYFLQFGNANAMLDYIDKGSAIFNQWSKNTYPAPLSEVFNKSLVKLGLNQEELRDNSDKLGKIVLAGWDPYFQSGTSLMIIFENGEIKSKASLQFNRGRSLAITDSKKLHAMAEKAFDREKSLFHDPNYLAARKKINPEKDELMFLYLSDYWLTNFISPRWIILSRRLAECDARIRLTEILRLAEKSEKTLAVLPSVELLRETYRDNSNLIWLIRDLKIDTKSNRVVHRELGPMFAHPAIDALPFTKVSKFEKDSYEDFKRTYTRNWREMDPLALQLRKDGSDIRCRLYISPISRLSEFRELAQVVLPKKQRHALTDSPNSAFGLSLLLQTQLLKPFLRQDKIVIPAQVQVSMRGLDMAPRVNSIEYIFKNARTPDAWSYSRAPVMLEVPTLAFNILTSMMNQDTGASDYPGLNKVNLSRNGRDYWIFQVFSNNGEDGFTRLSTNPNSLLQMIPKEDDKSVQTETPSDIYLFADFKKGYMLHRFLLMQAAQNRIVATWRREQRQRRIFKYFGAHLQAGIFPKPDRGFESATRGIPLPDDSEKSDGYNYGFFHTDSATSNAVPHLPPLLRDLSKVELFISVDNNSLLFESHLKVRERADMPAAPGARRPEQSEENNAQEADKLDFDDE